MIEVYNAITNIANIIEKDVFIGYDRFTGDNKTPLQIHSDVYKYCADIIEKEFEYLLFKLFI